MLRTAVRPVSAASRSEAELERLANLQEEHLVPRSATAGMQDLCRSLPRTRGTGDALTELEYMPTDSAEFIGKVAALRRAFQRHLRDDRNRNCFLRSAVLSERGGHRCGRESERRRWPPLRDPTRRGAAQPRAGRTVQQVTAGYGRYLRAVVSQTSTTFVRGCRTWSDEWSTAAKAPPAHS
jgi:hypothetical protein